MCCKMLLIYFCHLTSYIFLRGDDCPYIPQEDYFMNVYFGAIARDSLNSSRPISNPAETPIQINEMFDTVSYDKVLHVI